MSFTNALLGALNTGAGIYNKDQEWESKIIKDKASIDNTRANTALNRQAFDFNDLKNPIMLKAQELANQISQQSYNYNNQMNPLNLTGKQINNQINQQSYDYNNQMNPLNITGKQFENQSQQIKNRDDLDRFNAVEIVRNSFANNPDALDDFNAKRALGSSSWGRNQPDKVDFQKIYSPDGLGQTGVGTYDPKTNSIVPIPVQGQRSTAPTTDVQSVIGDSINSIFGTKEFNSEANQADFNVRLNEVYQAFLNQTKNPDKAMELTKEVMFKQLSLDDDTTNWFSDKELDYTPSDTQQQPPTITTDEEYLALPVGAQYIADGQLRVKK
jgi:hypothetical protein